MRKGITALSLVILLSIPAAGNAEAARLERAEGPQLAKAVGHYARARSLLLAAIREFDKGAKLANPSSLVDSEEWRDTVAARAKDLQRVLAPQPRASRDGIRYDADTRLLGDEVK